jgi:O-methyltransferase
MSVAASTVHARAAAVRASLAGAREPRAVGPGPEAEALRSAYLDLLKLCLCDLAGSTTVSVGPTPEGAVEAHELSGDQRRLRAAGLDWPLQGISMGGLRRLDDLQRCVTSVVRDGVEGDFIEAGAWRGGATILMRATLDSLGDQHDRTVWVADSFEGFPRSDDDGSRNEDLNAYLSAFEFLAVPEQEVKDNFARFGCQRGVRFVRGFFEDTLPDLDGQPWAIVRLDADAYEATRVALHSLYPGLASGGYLIVDDYGAADECRKAVDEFRSEQGITEPLEHVDWTCVRWRRGSEAPSEELRPEAPPQEAPSEPEPVARRSLSVPTVREVELAGEIENLRTRLGGSEAEISRLQNEMIELRDVLKEYEESRSWRMTRPLREARRLVRSLRRRRFR